MITPIPKHAPARDRWRGKAIGTIHEDTLPIFVYETALEEILEYSEQDRSHELGGFLIGGLHVDGGEYVEVRHFVHAEAAHSRAASLTFTHQTWSRLRCEIEQRFPEEMVVGWQHTHPNLGVFLSAYDVFLHRNFFGEPWQIAMVVDPQRQEFGFFQWRRNEIVDCGILVVESHGQPAD